MIVVKVFMWPGGDSSRERLLEQATISLDLGTRAEDELAGYTVVLQKAPRFGGPDEPDPTQSVRGYAWKRGRVEGFPRKSKVYGVWDLLRGALNVTLKGRWEPPKPPLAR